MLTYCINPFLLRLFQVSDVLYLLCRLHHPEMLLVHLLLYQQQLSLLWISGQKCAITTDAHMCKYMYILKQWPTKFCSLSLSCFRLVMRVWDEPCMSSSCLSTRTRRRSSLSYIHVHAYMKHVNSTWTWTCTCKYWYIVHVLHYTSTTVT